jgi:hypothetical protein
MEILSYPWFYMLRLRAWCYRERGAHREQKSLVEQKIIEKI